MAHKRLLIFIAFWKLSWQTWPSWLRLSWQLISLQGFQIEFKPPHHRYRFPHPHQYHHRHSFQSLPLLPHFRIQIPLPPLIYVEQGPLLSVEQDIEMAYWRSRPHLWCDHELQQRHQSLLASLADHQPQQPNQLFILYRPYSQLPQQLAKSYLMRLGQRQPFRLLQFQHQMGTSTWPQQPWQQQQSHQQLVDHLQLCSYLWQLPFSQEQLS